MDSIFGFSPTLLAAIAIFIGIYLVFFLIRLFADMVIVGVALSASLATFFIDEFYDQYISLISEVPFFKMLGIAFPTQPEAWVVFFIAGFVLILAVMICIPFLPFSETYRFILGIEKESMEKNEARVRQWITEELENSDKATADSNEDTVKTWVREEINGQDSLEEEKVRQWIRDEIEKMVTKTKLTDKKISHR